MRLKNCNIRFLGFSGSKFIAQHELQKSHGMSEDMKEIKMNILLNCKIM
jgi:hypothetical protein